MDSNKHKYAIGDEVLVIESEYEAVDLVATVGKKGIIAELWGSPVHNLHRRKGYTVAFSSTAEGDWESNWFEDELIIYTQLAESIYS